MEVVKDRPSDSLLCAIQACIQAHEPNKARELAAVEGWTVTGNSISVFLHRPEHDYFKCFAVLVTADQIVVYSDTARVLDIKR